jgi:SAM-dependent methyltransferase
MEEKLSELYPLKWFKNRTRSTKGPHVSSKYLAELIFNRFHPKRCIDLGCGTMSFVNRLSELGVRAYGVDGSEFNSRFAEGAKYIAHDLSKSFHLDKKFDLVTSWDVFEHIPESSEKVLVDTVKRLSSKWVLLSIDSSEWGRYHVNCKPKGYWRQLFVLAGFTFEKKVTKELCEAILADERITSNWYGRHLSVFRRPKRAHK